MTPWQLLRGNRGGHHAALGFRIQNHGQRVLVHYSSAPAAGTGPGTGRSFSLSREKETLQHLNGRLASYLQQVKRLEAANQKLERQIQEELDRKCPGELRHLDGHLRTTSLLQEQITESLTAQAQVKLHLLGAELDVYDLQARIEKEREQREGVEEELSDLRQIGAELQVKTLPELHSLVIHLNQQLKELKTQHQQDVQVLVARETEGPVVEVETAQVSHLIQQLDLLRRTGEALLDQNRNQNQSWFSTQVSVLHESVSPAVTFDPAAGAEEELQELWRTAADLEEELTHLQAQIQGLEASGQEQQASLDHQLDVLQRRADGLQRHLDSLQASAALQAEDHATLLNLKMHLEMEIQDYRCLLDGLRLDGVSSLQSTSHVTMSPLSPSTFRRNINTSYKPISVPAENIRILEAPVVSKGHVISFGQTPAVNHSPVASSNTVNLKTSFKKSEDQRDLHENKITNTKIGQSLDVGNSVKAAKPEIKNTPRQTRAAETLTSKQRTTQSSSQTNRTLINVQTEITRTMRGEEPELKQETRQITTGPVQQTSVEVTKETKTVTTHQTEITSTTASSKTHVNQEPETTTAADTAISPEGQGQILDPAQVESLSLETGEDAGEAAITVSVRSEETKMDDKETARQEKKEEEGVDVVEEDAPLSDVSIIEPNKTREDEDTKSEVSSSSDTGGETNRGNTTLVPATPSENTEITKLIICTEPGVNEEPATDKTTSDLEKPTVLQEVKETEIISSEDFGEIQGPEQVLSLETTAGTFGEVTVTAFVQSDKVHGKVSSELTLKDDEEPEQQETKEQEEVGGSPSHLGFEGLGTSEDLKNEQLEIVEEESNDILEPEIEVLKIVEGNEVEEVVSFHHIDVVKVDPPRPDEEIVNLKSQEIYLSNKDSKKSTSTIDSGVGLGSSPPEELLSPTEPVQCLSPDLCLSPVEPEMPMSLNDQVFCAVDREEVVLTPDSLLGPDDQEMLFSPDDSDTCFSPVEDQACFSPEAEDDDDVCLTEANVQVRPVEKYVLTTREEAQSLSMGGGGGGGGGCILPDDGKRKVNISVRDGGSLCFGTFEGDEGGRGASMSNSRPTSRQSPGVSGGPEGQSKVEQKGTVSGSGDAAAPPAGGYGRFGRSGGGYSFYGGTLGQTSAGSSENQPETGKLGSRGSGERIVYGRKSSLDGSISLATGKGKEEPVSTNPREARPGSSGSGEVILYGGSLGLKSKARESSPVMIPGANQSERGRFGSGEWMVYSGKDNLAMSPPRSSGSGEWRVYGGSSGRLSSWAGSSSLPNADSEEIPSKLPMSPPGSQGGRRVGSNGSGEWRVYGRMSTWAGSGSLPNADSQEIPPKLPTSPPGSTGGRRIGSTGSGEWRVYGRMSSWAGSSSLPKAEQQEVPAKPPMSPPGSTVSSRICSGGSGEWRVYSGATGRSSRPGSADRVGGNYGQVISPPSSHTGSGQRRSSAGRMGSGNVVRRSSSVGSGGRLSATGSGSRISGTGKFTSTGSVEGKPVYSSTSGRRSSSGTGGQRAPSPGGRMTVGSWLSAATPGGERVGSTGSGSKLSSSGASERISTRGGGKVSSSAGSGRTGSTGGRVITSSNGPIRSTGSGAGGQKERISVCKMAALSMSAAGRERSLEKQKQAQKKQQQQHQQAAGSSPLVQRWLSSSADPSDVTRV